MLHSLLDDEHILVNDVSEKVSNTRRLGAFFKPWYFNILDDSILNYFDLNKLKEKTDKIDWIKNDNYITESQIIEIDNRHYFAHYISKLILNQFIGSDDLFKDLQKDSLKFEFTYKLKSELEGLRQDIQDCYDHEILSQLKTYLYIYRKKPQDLYIKFRIESSGLHAIELTFEYEKFNFERA